MRVTKITNEKIQKIREKTPTYLYGNRPNMEGFSPSQIRDNLAHVLLDPSNSIISLINDLIGEINITKEDIVVLQDLPASWDEYESEVLFIVENQSFYYVNENHEPLVMDLSSKYTLFSAEEIPSDMRVLDFCLLKDKPLEVSATTRKVLYQADNRTISTPTFRIKRTKLSIESAKPKITSTTLTIK